MALEGFFLFLFYFGTRFSTFLMEIDIFMDHKHPIFWGVQLYMAILKRVSRHLGLPPLLLSLLDGGNVSSLKGSFVDFARV
jgi:hypothetical protein